MNFIFNREIALYKCQKIFILSTYLIFSLFDKLNIQEYLI